MEEGKNLALEVALSVYDPKFQYLTMADFLDDRATGSFSVKERNYLAQDIDTGHLNAADLLICYNQLAFAWYVSMNPDVSKENLARSGVIVSIKQLRFHKPVSREEFIGEISGLVQRDGKSFGKTRINFGEGAVTGEILLGYLKDLEVI